MKGGQSLQWEGKVPSFVGTIESHQRGHHPELAQPSLYHPGGNHVLVVRYGWLTPGVM